MLGDGDLLEAEGAHRLDQDHDAGDDRRPGRIATRCSAQDRKEAVESLGTFILRAGA